MTCSRTIAEFTSIVSTVMSRRRLKKPSRKDRRRQRHDQLGRDENRYARLSRLRRRTEVEQLDYGELIETEPA